MKNKKVTVVRERKRPYVVLSGLVGTEKQSEGVGSMRIEGHFLRE